MAPLIPREGEAMIANPEDLSEMALDQTAEKDFQTFPTTTVESKAPVAAIPASDPTDSSVATTFATVQPTPTAATLPTPEISKMQADNAPGLGPGGIALIVGGLLLFTSLLIIAIVMLRRRHLKRRKQSKHDSSSQYWAGMFQPSKPDPATANRGISRPIPLTALQARGAGTTTRTMPHPSRSNPQKPQPPLPSAPSSLPHPSTFLDHYNARTPSPRHPPPSYPGTAATTAGSAKNIAPQRGAGRGLRRSLTNSLRSALEFNNKAYDYYAVERERELARSRALAKAKAEKEERARSRSRSRGRGNEGKKARGALSPPPPPPPPKDRQPQPQAEMVDVCLGPEVALEEMQKMQEASMGLDMETGGVSSWNEVNRRSMSPFPAPAPPKAKKGRQVTKMETLMVVSPLEPKQMAWAHAYQLRGDEVSRWSP